MSAPRGDLPTHLVENQPPERADIDLWAGDPALRRAAGNADTGILAGFGAALGRDETRALARQANSHLPALHLFDRAGRRLDEVAFHPAYHALMTLGLEAGYASAAWTGGSHVTHAAMVYMLSQVEPGVCCPMTMSYAGVPALAADPGLAARWVPKLTTPAYDPTIAPVTAKRAVTLGMAMTEKQGGSDVRANTTRAERDGDGWRLTGHKWFCSAPMSDGFLTLAQAPGGLTCFLVPRWLDDGTRNAIHLMRLKDKLGNRANASAEIEYHRAYADQLGEEGAGVRTIIAMVHHTRLDTGLAPAGLMRAALGEALHWVRHRSTFQRRLIDQPLMRAVLADTMLDWQGALALGMRVAQAFDDPDQAAFARIAVALAKFLNNKRCPQLVYECMEVLGGMGYVEDTPLPMLYREAPLNSIWEGSGNVICLDILRSLTRDGAAAEALKTELLAAWGSDARFDAALNAHWARWPGLPDEADARAWAERMAVLLTAATLLHSAPGPVAEGYIAARVAEQGTRIHGTAAGLDVGAILSAFDGH